MLPEMTTLPGKADEFGLRKCCAANIYHPLKLADSQLFLFFFMLVNQDELEIFEHLSEKRQGFSFQSNRNLEILSRDIFLRLKLYDSNLSIP